MEDTKEILKEVGSINGKRSWLKTKKKYKTKKALSEEMRRRSLKRWSVDNSSLTDAKR